MKESTSIEELVAENVDLREQLMDQWLSNHAEHCGANVPPWPHPGMCHWPMPPALRRHMSASEVYSLLLEVLAKDDSPRLQSLAG